MTDGDSWFRSSDEQRCLVTETDAVGGMAAAAMRCRYGAVRSCCVYLADVDDNKPEPSFG